MSNKTSVEISYLKCEANEARCKLFSKYRAWAKNRSRSKSASFRSRMTQKRPSNLLCEKSAPNKDSTEDTTLDEDFGTIATEKYKAVSPSRLLLYKQYFRPVQLEAIQSDIGATKSRSETGRSVGSKGRRFAPSSRTSAARDSTQIETERDAVDRAIERESSSGTVLLHKDRGPTNKVENRHHARATTGDGRDRETRGSSFAAPFEGVRNLKTDGINNLLFDLFGEVQPTSQATSSSDKVLETSDQLLEAAKLEQTTAGCDRRRFDAFGPISTRQEINSVESKMADDLWEKIARRVDDNERDEQSAVDSPVQVIKPEDSPVQYAYKSIPTSDPLIFPSASRIRTSDPLTSLSASRTPTSDPPTPASRKPALNLGTSNSSNFLAKAHELQSRINRSSKECFKYQRTHQKAQFMLRQLAEEASDLKRHLKVLRRQQERAWRQYRRSEERLKRLKRADLDLNLEYARVEEKDNCLIFPL